MSEVLAEMGNSYRADPVLAVRGQGFIKLLHAYIGSQLSNRLTSFARRRRVRVVSEATILGSTKPKDVDIAVIDPDNGPLLMVGVRSQMLGSRIVRVPPASAQRAMNRAATAGV